MGHAHHFLSRLDRLSREHVELTLALYRDDARLRYVLEQAKLPERAERVAISLDDPHEGPFVLVTRTGRFVTCLGRGMHAENLPLITRAEFDALGRKHGLWQDREEAARRLGDADGGASFLMGRLFDAGPYLAREELQALAALHPLVGDLYLEMAGEWTRAAQKLLAQLKPALKKRGPRLRPDQLEKLEVHWKTFFAAGHLAVLSVVDDGEMVRQRAGADFAGLEAIGNYLASIIVDGCIVAKTIRSTWALTQLGAAWIPVARRRLAEARTGLDVMQSTFALLALGARDPACRAEVVSIFSSVPRLATEEASSWANYVCGGGVNLLADVEARIENHRKMGAGVAVVMGELYPEASPYHYRREEDVPADIAYAHPFHFVSNFGLDKQMQPTAVTMIVAAARATPEDLYLPRRCVETLDQKWTPQHSMLLLEGELALARRPAPRPSGPTRNGPCPCGSGKKYKRCCAVAEVD